VKYQPKTPAAQKPPDEEALFFSLSLVTSLKAVAKDFRSRYVVGNDLDRSPASPNDPALAVRTNRPECGSHTSQGTSLAGSPRTEDPAARGFALKSGSRC